MVYWIPRAWASTCKILKVYQLPKTSINLTRTPPQHFKVVLVMVVVLVVAPSAEHILIKAHRYRISGINHQSKISNKPVILLAMIWAPRWVRLVRDRCKLFSNNSHHHFRNLSLILSTFFSWRIFSQIVKVHWKKWINLERVIVCLRDCRIVNLLIRIGYHRHMMTVARQIQRFIIKVIVTIDFKQRKRYFHL